MGFRPYIVEALVDEAPEVIFADADDEEVETEPFWQYYAVLQKRHRWMDPANKMVTRIVPGVEIKHGGRVLLQMVVYTRNELDCSRTPDGEGFVIRAPLNGEVFVGAERIYYLTPRRAVSIASDVVHKILWNRHGEETGPDLMWYLLPDLLEVVEQKVGRLVGLPNFAFDNFDEIDCAAAPFLQDRDPYEISEDDLDEIAMEVMSALRHLITPRTEV